MNEQPILRHDDVVSYIHSCVAAMAREWNREHVNNSGLRATFRRWHPHGGNHAPSMEMRSEIWARMGAPLREGESPSDTPLTRQQLEVIDRAATIVAIRAMAGEHGGEERALGTALHDADLSDLRLMRLLTTPPSGRLEAIIRAAKRLDASNAAVTWNRREVVRLNDFLFENENRARQAVNGWAADFFRASWIDNQTSNQTTTTNQTTANQE
jgi:hypothetical protein